MSKKKIVVKIEELPVRAENLGYSKIHEIYGGECIHVPGSCCNDSDCCSGYCRLFICC